MATTGTVISTATTASSGDPIVGMLRSVPLFATLDDDARRELARHCRRRVEAADVPLFHEGDEPGSLYVVLSGTVLIRSVTEAGRTVHLAQRGPGEQIGELSLLDGEPRMADAVTGSACELLVLRRDAFLRCLREHPDIALALLASLANRLREAAHHQEQREEQDVTGRLAILLLDWVERHGDRQPSGAIRLTIRRTHQQIAEQVGSARESVSRALAEMRRLGVVRTEGRDLIIQDLARLRRQAKRH